MTETYNGAITVLGHDYDYRAEEDEGRIDVSFYLDDVWVGREHADVGHLDEALADFTSYRSSTRAPHCPTCGRPCAESDIYRYGGCPKCGHKQPE
jgi:hypothetical protein